jgi:hypothetical protein
LEADRERMMAYQKSSRQIERRYMQQSEPQDVPNEEAAVETIGAQEDRFRDQQPAVEYRNPLKWLTKHNVVPGIPKRRTCEKRRRARPERNNRINDRGIKQRLRLGKENALNERTLCEALRRIFELEAVEIEAVLSGRIRKIRE